MATGSGGRKAKNTSVWRPSAPFDSSTSKVESMTLTYDPIKDKHLSKDFRRRLKAAREVGTLHDDYAHTDDRLSRQMRLQKRTENVVKLDSLARRYGSNARMFARTWDIWPERAAYYPTSIGAGGADLNSIQSAMGITSPKASVPCTSVLSPHSKDYVDALRSSSNKSQENSQPASPKSQRSLSGVGGSSNSLQQLAMERRLHEMLPSSPKRSLGGIGVRRQRPHTSQPSVYSAPPGPLLYSSKGAAAANRMRPSTTGEKQSIDFTSGAWLRSFGSKRNFDTSIYLPTPATQHSLAVHVVSNNFTMPYTKSAIVDI